VVVAVLEFSLNCPTDEVGGLDTPDAKFDFGTLLGLEFLC